MKELTCVRDIYELKIGDKTYHFRLSFMCWYKLEKEYGTNAYYIIQNILIGIDRITNMMRVAACACEEEITFEELLNKIEFTPQNLEEVDKMIGVVIGLKESTKGNNDSKKNSKPEQNEHIVDYEYYYTFARGYLGYSYNEFWHEANPYEVIGLCNRYAELNGWNKSEEDDADGSSTKEKSYFTIDDL